MSGPGVYVPDVTEGITRVEDLPQPRIKLRSRNFSCRRCPFCGGRGGRWGVASRTVHDLGDPLSGRPIDLHICYSTHRCLACRRSFPADQSDLAPLKSQYTHRVQQTAVRLVIEDDMPYRMASWHLWRDHRVFVPWATIQNWVEAAGEKSRAAVDTVYLERALTRFSGYIAIDELYDGPFCVLSLVDNRAFIRLSFRVLEHDPTQNDIRRFLADFKARLDVRGLAVRGVTTDGSELYPEPLKELWPDVPHQVCEFHVIKEITKAVLHALVATRKKLRDRIPKQPRGRPRKAERAQSRKATRQQQQVSKLFEHRYLFVQHRLTADQKTTLQRITRGLAHLRRLRQIMEEVYRLFDRRCRTETALARLAQLRGRVSRCKRLGRALDKLSSPNLEKALTFLDDKLLPATSNAVERSNRRYRKAQKSIYSVRTAEHIRQRIALDMQRDQQAPDRAQTTKALHQARSGTKKLQE